VLEVNYIVPLNLYPKKQFILPNIMTQSEVEKLFLTNLSLKEYCAIRVLYDFGICISEVCNLRIQDIESGNQSIKVYQGKRAKDCYTLLPSDLFYKLRALYIDAARPKDYLFTSSQMQKAYCVRPTQVVVNGLKIG
jgi:integrase